MGGDKIPKVFISYSWNKSDEILDLANRLMSDQIEVLLDQWELKEGQDKYVFMERCVNDPDIDKVLIICDSNYKEKADKRKGGVGDETSIITPELYGKAEETKFLPIIVERDEDGESYIPAYLRSRIYIDLSNVEIYDDEYQKLVRSIYNKPLIKKPPLGNKPKWLDNDRRNFYPLEKLINGIKNSKSTNKQIILIDKFIEAYIDLAKCYYDANANDPKKIYETFQEMKTIRDYFLDFLEALLEVEFNLGEKLCDVFELLYNKLINIYTFDKAVNTLNDYKLEVFKLHIWELFICSTTFLLNYEKYEDLNVILKNAYFLIESDFGGNRVASNYYKFYHYSRILEERYKPKTSDSKLYTITGKTLCKEREKHPIYSSENLTKADLFLYQVYNGFNLVKKDYPCWFPLSYLYVSGEMSEWVKLKSKRYCRKMFKLFGVENIEELKKTISKCQMKEEVRFQGSFDAAPGILKYIKLDEIGTLN